MYFVTDNAWEVTDPVEKALQGAEGRFFPYVELALNQPLWHLDLLVSVEHGAKCWRRFILTSLEQAVSTAEEYPGTSQLHYQSALSPSADRGYGIWHVQKVLVGRCPDGSALLETRPTLYAIGNHPGGLCQPRSPHHALSGLALADGVRQAQVERQWRAIGGDAKVLR